MKKFPTHLLGKQTVRSTMIMTTTRHTNSGNMWIDDGNFNKIPHATVRQSIFMQCLAHPSMKIFPFIYTIIDFHCRTKNFSLTFSTKHIVSNNRVHEMNEMNERKGKMCIRLGENAHILLMLWFHVIWRLTRILCTRKLA